MIVDSGPASAYGPTGAGGGTTTLPTPTTVKQATSHGLAFTGTDAEITTAAGAAAIGVGGLAVLATRRRRAAK